MRDRALLFKRAVTEGFAAAVARGFLAAFTRLRQCSSFLVSRCKHALHYEIFLSRTSTATSCSPRPRRSLFIISTRSARLPHSHFFFFLAVSVCEDRRVHAAEHLEHNYLATIFLPSLPAADRQGSYCSLIYIVCFGQTPGGGGLRRPLKTPELCIRWVSRHVPRFAPGQTKPALTEKQMLSAVVGCQTPSDVW